MADEITKGIEVLKKCLDNAGENRQVWLENEVFPLINKRNPFDVLNLCIYFEVDINEFQAWKWLSQMPKGHVKKIRRRIEERLRKGTPMEILKVANLLNVSTATE